MTLNVAKRYSTRRRSTRRWLVGLIAAMAVVGIGSPSSAQEPATPGGSLHSWLHWRNGDRLSGEAIEFDGKVLQWKAPPFATALRLDGSALESIRFQASGGAGESGGRHVRVELVNGDVLFGKLSGLDKATIALTSPRHGSISIQTASVVRLTQASPASVLYDSDGRLAGWDTRDSLRGDWTEEPGVGLVTDRFGAELFRAVEFPDTVEVDFQLEWDESPGFAITLVDKTAPGGTLGLFNQLAKGLGIKRNRPRRSARDDGQLPVFQLVVWGNTLVLETRGDFSPIVDIPKDKKKIQIRVFWNRPEGKIVVLTDVDGQATSVDVPLAAGSWSTGIGIKNYSRSLVVSSVRASKWDGTVPTQQGNKNVTVVAIDGRQYSAVPTQWDPQSGQLTLDDGTTVAMKDVAELRWAKRVPVDRDALLALDRVKYSDGSVVHGKLQEIKGGAATFVADYAKAAFLCRFADGATALEFANPSDKPKGTKFPFVLRTEDGSLQGRLVPITDGTQFQLGWEPAGSVQAAVIDGEQDLEIERVGKEPLPKVLSIIDVAESDVLFLKSTDIVPARVFGYDDRQLTVRTMGGKQQSLSDSLVRAIGFAREGVSANLVQSDKWKEKANRPNDVKREENRIEFYRQGASTWHPTALQIPKVAFRTRHNRSNYAQMMIYAFAKDVERPKNAVRLGLYANGREFYYYFGFDDNIGYSQFPGARNSTIDWEIKIDGKEAVLSANGEEVARESLPNNAQVGKGLRFELQGGSSAGARTPLITISNLRLPNFGDPFQVITGKDKEIVLQVPRRYRLKMPTHLLLAKTGDLLRGQLKSMDEDAVTFTVRTAPQRIPRSRLAGVLWFELPQKNGEGDEEGAVPSGHSAENPAGSIRVMTPTSRITLVPTGIDGDQLIGESPVVGPIRIAMRDILLWEFGTSRRPVGEAAFSDWQPKVAAEPVGEGQ